MSQLDWLSHLLQMITVTGRLEVRCAYGAPWRVAYDQSAAREIPYHVVLKGRAVLEDPESQTGTSGGSFADTTFAAAKHPKSFISMDNADHLLTRRADADYAAAMISTWADRYLA